MGHGANDQADGGGNGSEPVIALSAPAGIALASPRSIALGAGEHIDAAAQQHLQLTAGEQMLLNAGQGLGTFAQSGDMRHIAHQGQLLLQAQHNSARLEADQSVEVSASQQHIVVNAKTHLTLLCGGAYVKIADGNIEMGMPGDFVVKAGKHSLVGPGSASLPLPRWSKSDAGNWIEINHRGADDQQFGDAAGVILAHRLAVDQLIEGDARQHLQEHRRPDDHHGASDKTGRPKPQVAFLPRLLGGILA